MRQERKHAVNAIAGNDIPFARLIGNVLIWETQAVAEKCVVR